jgi:hypothetical protein
MAILPRTETQHHPDYIADLNLDDALNSLPTEGIPWVMFNAELVRLNDQIGENSLGGWQVSQYWESVVEQMQKNGLEGKMYESYNTTQPNSGSNTKLP